MAVTAAMVKELREMTGAGMMDCKKALVEADGDFEKAIEVLRKKGQPRVEIGGAEKYFPGLLGLVENPARIGVLNESLRVVGEIF